MCSSEDPTQPKIINLKIYIYYRSLLLNTVPVVKNSILHTSQFVRRADLMVSVLTTKTRTTKHKRTGGNSQRGWICLYFDCGDGFTGVDICQSSLDGTL